MMRFYGRFALFFFLLLCLLVMKKQVITLFGTAREDTALRIVEGDTDLINKPTFIKNKENRNIESPKEGNGILQRENQVINKFMSTEFLKPQYGSSALPDKHMEVIDELQKHIQSLNISLLEIKELLSVNSTMTASSKHRMPTRVKHINTTDNDIITRAPNDYVSSERSTVHTQATDEYFASDIVQYQKYRNIWNWANNSISHESLFPGKSPEVDTVLNALATARILSIEWFTMGKKFYENGTSFKWIAMLEGGQKAVIKLAWEEFGGQKKGGRCNDGHELPAAEIAAFHLHRILGFYNTPYVSGRWIDLIHEIYPVACEFVRKQITLLPNGDACVSSGILMYNDNQTLCVSGGKIKASIGYWIPRPLKLYTWYPKYAPFSMARKEWLDIGFNNKSYCDKIPKTIKPYDQVNYYNDLFDFGLLDMLMYHFDTKHYVIDDGSSANGLTIRLDHGRAFCCYERDSMNRVFAPIKQCCSLRKTTYERLKAFRHGNVLSLQLKSALKKDPLYPVLFEGWYSALERRLGVLFDTLEKCIQANGRDNVLLSS